MTRDPDDYMKLSPEMLHELLETLAFYARASNHWNRRPYRVRHFGSSEQKSYVAVDCGQKARDFRAKWEEKYGTDKLMGMDGPEVGTFKRGPSGTAEVSRSVS